MRPWGNSKAKAAAKKAPVDGDALSTSCFVLGYEKGKKLIQEMNRTDPSIKAVFIDSENRVE